MVFNFVLIIGLKLKVSVFFSESCIGLKFISVNNNSFIVFLVRC